MATTKKASTKNEENQSHTLKKKNLSKRKPKNEIKFNLQLNEEQKNAKKLILENDIIVLLGRAGSGKTLLGCQGGIDLFFNREVEKIRITRPTVSDEELGFLPGDISDKLDPWLQPIYHNFYQLYDKKKIQEMVKTDEIIISPLAYMRGITYLDECLITGEQILTENGWMNIEDVYNTIKEESDVYVYSYNEINEKIEKKPLTIMKKSPVDSYVKITLEDGTTTNVSAGHKFYTKRGIVQAKDLREDDEIISG